MELIVQAKQGETTGLLHAGNASYPCALGKAGIIPASQKREGDGATPAGRWGMTKLYYRPDRLMAPTTLLPITPMTPEMGWCDDQADLRYNQLVTLPFAPSHEEMWRQDHVYDVVVELNYNRSPIIAGKGSAIFFHLAKPDFSPTLGCVAITLEAMLALLGDCTPQSAMRIELV